jgi:hypothetical protein
MKRSTANTTPCGCCGRRLPTKRRRAYCGPACREIAILLIRRRRETGAGGQR